MKVGYEYTKRREDDKVFTLFPGGKTQQRYLEYFGTCKFVSVHLLTDFVYLILAQLCVQ